MKILEIRQQIRFALEQLTINNGHHEFEHICRDFARIRICRNILKATGPVSAGGDNGRDFETYKTPNCVEEFPVSISERSGEARDLDLFFCCSLNKSIIKKIKDDITSIFSKKNITVNKKNIIYFCTANLQVSKRQELEDWCKKKFDVGLQIFDGENLSELLSDQDLFSIAVEYLSIPAESYPSLVDNEDKSYNEYRERWIFRQELPINFADFWQIKSGIRYSTVSNIKKVDLNGWIKAMSAFFASPLLSLKRKAQYEVCVASLRGMNHLNNYKHLVIDYFSDIENLIDIDDLNDAVILLQYCYGAFKRENFSIDKDELYTIYNKLNDRFAYLMTARQDPQIKCSLLEIKIRLNLLDVYHGTTHANITNNLFRDLEKLVPLIEGAAFFPLESFCEVFNNLCIVWLESDERFLNITAKIDKLLHNRIGDFAVAEQSRDRGAIFYDSGNILQAIFQFRNAIYYWSTHETLKGSILGMLTMSEIYNELGLHYAAKYYALGAVRSADIRHNLGEDLIPRSLARVCRILYNAGEWLNYFLVARKFLETHFAYSADRLDIEKNKDLKNMLYICKQFPIMSYFFAPSTLPVLEEFNKGSFLDDSIITDYDLIKNNINISKETILAQLEGNGMGKPFSDIGTRRNVSWRALGINWTVTFDNNYDSTLAGEEFIALLQVMLVEISQIDLKPLPLFTVINFTLKDDIFNIKDESSNNVLMFTINLPNEIAFNKRYDDYVSHMIDIFSRCFVIERCKLGDKMRELFKQRQLNVLTCIGNYQELYKFSISKDLFNSFATFRLAHVKE